MRRFVLACLAAFPVLASPFEAFAGGAHWDGEAAVALIRYAEGIGRQGLDPSSYDTRSLAASVERGDAVAVELAASTLFERLAHDLAAGVTPDDRGRWRMEKPAPEKNGGAEISAAMESALASGDIPAALDAFAPPQAEYRALKAALADAPEGDDGYRRKLRINMERWRFMPRDLGADYVLVNAPSYEAVIVREGKEVARRRVVVGKKKTPTPQFSASITGVIVNPTWFVPSSIVEESVGALLEKKPEEAARQGYYVAGDGGVRQQPGPDNALGQMKLAMPNPYSVFIHDTPFRKNFELDRRALSHGCIRIEDAFGFAAEILDGTWSKDMMSEIAATGSTATIDLPAPMPVYVVYFTAMTNAAGEVAVYPDIYNLDKTLLSESVRAPAVIAAALDSETCPAEASG